MSETKNGSIGWIDLTVPDAASLKGFYERVAGWSVEPVNMDGYSDYCMHPAGGDEPVAGICHARGSNADLPAQWLIYITVPDLEESLRQCRAAKGEVLTKTKPAGEGRCAVIRDPAGAVCALYEDTAPQENSNTAA